MDAKLKSLALLHRGGEQLAQLTLECDLEALPEMLDSLDCSELREHHLEEACEEAKRLAKQRADERDAAAKKKDA